MMDNYYAQLVGIATMGVAVLSGCVTTATPGPDDRSSEARRWEPVAQIDSVPGVECALSPDGQVVVTYLSRDIVFESLRDHSRVRRAWAGEGTIQSLQMDADGVVWLTCTDSAQISRVDFESRNVSRPRRYGMQPVTKVASADDGRTVITLGGDGVIRAFDWETAEPRWNRPIDAITGYRVAFSKNAEMVAYAVDRGVVLERARDGEQRVKWELDGRPVHSVGVSSDGTRVVTFQRGAMLFGALTNPTTGLMSSFSRTKGPEAQREFSVLSGKGTSEWLESLYVTGGSDPCVICVSTEALRAMRPSDLQTVLQYSPLPGQQISASRSTFNVRQQRLAVRKGTSVLVFELKDGETNQLGGVSP